MSRSIALQTMRFAAELRTNLELMRRSRRVSPQTTARAAQECALFLAQANLIYPPSMRATGLAPGLNLHERKQVLGLGASGIEETPETLEFQELLASAGRKTIKMNWIWRIGQEAVDMCREGWFGFFVTLTVDPSRVYDSQAMWMEGREFSKYIRNLARVSCRACGQPRAIKDGASVRDYVRHVGVIEHGASQDHHHMHVLVWMRGIPSSWKVCPNRGIRDPQHRIHDWCRAMSTYWPHALPGLGRAKYFRHEGDMWSRHGFALPWDAKKQRVIRIHSAEKAGLYIAKYMDKDDKVWLHRIKATRNLGLTRLRKMVMELHLNKVEALTWRPRAYRLSVLATTIHSVPSALLRSIAKQELFFRKWASATLDYRTLLLPSIEVFSAMLKSVQNGDSPRRMRSSQFYEWVSRHLPEPPGYCEQRYLRACHSLGAYFRPVPSSPVQHLGVV